MRRYTILALLAAGLVACTTPPSPASHAASLESVRMDESGTAMVLSNGAGAVSG